ncbi:MAG: anaerobic ribonucleoside-triphosphate reductase activating protein [Turicibacter sp.]
MNYAQMRKYDISNGTGIRASLFVSGCVHNCPACFNQEYQNFKYGKKWTQVAEDEFMSYLKDPNVHGVTILGGEPMDQTKDDDLLLLVSKIKATTNQTIWIYSGYTYEQILADPKKFEILKHCDVLVDGKFVEALKDLKLKFRGSSNQRIIDVQASLNSKEICLVEQYK